MGKLTCYACDGEFREGVWVDGGEWTFYCPECYRKNEEQFPCWKYAEKRYLTKDNNNDNYWGECFWCNTISHEAMIEYDDNGEQICPVCKRAGAMLKV